MTTETKSYILPVIQALLLHGLILGAFVSGWSFENENRTPPPPVIVQAKVLTMEDPVIARQQAEEQRQQQAAKAQEQQRQQRLDQQRRIEEQKRAEERRVAEQRKVEEQRKVAEQRKAEEERKLAEQKKQEEANRLAEERRKREEAQRLAEQRRRDELEDSLRRESERVSAAEETAGAQSYAGLIRSRVIQNWHRPLSARNGMEAILRIGFLPTGEVSTVVVTRGSGDEAFDNSAVLAVRRMGKVDELQQLSPRVFDANFRNLTIRFRPEDLDR